MTCPHPLPWAAKICNVIIAVAMYGCGAESASPREVLWQPGEAWSVSSQPRLTIGVRDGDELYQFFDVSAAARQADGDLVVADEGARTVRLYSPDGVVKRILGSGGSGPGEFQGPRQILIEAEDSIVVWDDVLFRLTRFDSEGNFAEVQSFSRGTIAKAATPPLYPGSALLLSGGDLLVRLVEKRKDLPASGRFRRRSGALRVFPDASVVDTFLMFADVEQVVVESPWGPLPVVPPLAKNTSIAVQPGAPWVCIGDQEGPDVRCFEADGTVNAVRWQATPTTVRANDREVLAWRDSAIALYGQKLTADAAEQLVSLIPTPTERPEYTQLVLDREGNLWVRRGPNARDESDAVEYLVFDRTGKLFGPFHLPPISILEIGSDYIIGVHRDELEVQYLQVFEIVKPTRTESTPNRR